MWRVGGLNFSGPAEPAVTSIYWNPGAIALLKGTNVYGSGLVSFVRYDAARTPIDPATGLPQATGSLRFASVQRTEIPVDFFVGLVSDLGTEKFSLAVGAYTPHHRQLHWPSIPGTSGTNRPSEDGPGRYAVTDLDLRTTYLTVLAGYRFADSFSFGMGLSFVIADMTYAFDTDLALTRPDLAQLGNGCAQAPCGFENPLAAQRYRLSTRGFGLSWTAGFLWRIVPRLDLGVAFVSRVLGIADGTLRGRIEADGPSQVTAPASPSVTKVGLAPSSLLLGNGRLAYATPDVVHLGLRWRVRGPFSLTLNLRYANTRVMDAVAVTLAEQIPRPDPTVVPPRQLRYLGYRDSVVTEVRAAWRFGQRGRVGLGVAYDTGAVPAESASALSWDGPQILLLAAGEYHWRRFTFGAGYQLSVMPARTTDSIYDPRAALSCLNAGGDIHACAAADAGRGLPTQAGRYGAIANQVGAHVNVRF